MRERRAEKNFSVPRIVNPHLAKLTFGVNFRFIIRELFLKREEDERERGKKFFGAPSNFPTAKWKIISIPRDAIPRYTYNSA